MTIKAIKNKTYAYSFNPSSQYSRHVVVSQQKLEPLKLKRIMKKQSLHLVFKETNNSKIYISFRDLSKGLIT